MILSLAADAALLVHLAFILFAAAGGLLVLWRPWIAFLQIPAGAWGAFVEISGKACPLTHLENYFLIRAGRAGYTESFVSRYLMPVVYPPGLTREIQYLLAALVLCLNLAIYGFLIYRITGKRA
nr:DUF2784 domain-containing protein [Desulfobacula sp.]